MRKLLPVVGLFSVLALLLPAGADPLAKLQVVDSSGVASALGIVTRVPAESPGGAVYAASSITADKSIGRAAGFYPGYLVDAFFRTSSDAYTNPSEAVAQHPPGAHPERAETQGSAQGPYGRGARFAAEATDAPMSRASATAARLAPAGLPLQVGSAEATSRSTVLGDGTVVTETASLVRELVVANVLTATELAAEGTVRTPPGGKPSTALRTTLAGLLLNGVPVSVSDQGLRISDRSVVTPGQVAAFNNGMAALAAAGITVRAAPRAVDEQPGAARVSGAALEVGWNTGQNSLEEIFLVAQVGARAVAEPAVELADDAPAVLAGRDDPPLSPDALGSDAPLALGVPSTRPAADAVVPAAAPSVSGDAPTTMLDPLALLGARPDTRLLERVRHLYLVVVLLALLGGAVAMGAGRRTA